MKYFVAGMMLLICLIGTARADFRTAMAAYERQDYATAFKEFNVLAENGHADAQFMMGHLYAEGQGVIQDYVKSYMWLNLAAAHGKVDVAKARDQIAQKMTAEQIAEAQRLAREWKPATTVAAEEKTPTAQDTASSPGQTPTAVSGEGTETSEQSIIQSDVVQEFVNQLNALIDKAEQSRAAKSWFINDLQALANRYEWPWKVEVLFDDFSDGDYTNNPAWTVASGRLFVDAQLGLRSIIEQQTVQSRQSTTEAKDVALSVLKSILEKRTQPEGGTTATAPKDRSEIYIAGSITNSFAIRIVLTSREIGSGFEFGPYQGTDRMKGYRLAYRPGAGQGLELLRSSLTGTSTVKVYNQAVNLEDNNPHVLEWRRNRIGKMAVSLDGQELFTTVDRSINEAFDGITLINQGGDYAVRQVKVYGIK